jgi:pyruvate dehydrogenase E1 component beta subunit
MLRPALAAADELKARHGVSAEVIDLLTLSPLDDTLFCASVQKTGHALIVHEAPMSYGPGAEIAARIVDKSFFYLQKPVERITGFDVTIPLFSRENDYLPNPGRIISRVKQMLES